MQEARKQNAQNLSPSQKKVKKSRKKSKKVIHIKECEKIKKMELYTKLCTLST